MPAIFDAFTSKASSMPLFVTDSLSNWRSPEGNAHKGLLVRRTFDVPWDGFQYEIDEACSRFGRTLGLTSKVANDGDEALPDRLLDSINGILATAELPKALSGQIQRDAVSIGSSVGALCPTARELELKLEIFGENVCARWHKDNFVGRAITSYTGTIGTEYSRDSNINYWELENCGCNDKIIRDTEQIEHVGVGDILFIKGTRFPQGANGLVHRSPDKRFHEEDGRIVNRLVLKVDVHSVGEAPTRAAPATVQRPRARVVTRSVAAKPRAVTRSAAKRERGA